MFNWTRCFSEIWSKNRAYLLDYDLHPNLSKSAQYLATVPFKSKHTGFFTWLTDENCKSGFQLRTTNYISQKWCKSRPPIYCCYYSSSFQRQRSLRFSLFFVIFMFLIVFRCNFHSNFSKGDNFVQKEVACKSRDTISVQFDKKCWL
jgi:hypothetical protein